MPHLLVMFFAEPGPSTASSRASPAVAWNDGVRRDARGCATSNLGGVEPFGFADGISQPQIDWSQERDVSAGQIDYSNVVALGEFLLGYRNEYGKYTDRPVLDAGAASAGLPAAEDAPDKKDLGRNGTYLVMRQLRQDVRGFWQFVAEQAGGDPAAAEKLAAAFVGRTRAGDPLVPVRDRPFPASARSRTRFARISSRSIRTRRVSRCPVRRARAPCESAQHGFSRAADRPAKTPHRDRWASDAETSGTT